MTTRIHHRGFTLIELLIAMSIMLSMLVLAALAYQSYTKTWEKDLSKIEQSYQEFRYNELLLDAMQSIIPLPVTDEASQAYYFLGREEGFTAITYAPVFNVGYPAVIRVFREQNSEGRFQLVYEEASLQNTVLKSAQQILPFAKRQIIYRDISHIAFSYYGWKDHATRMASLAGPDVTLVKEPEWFIEYDGLKRQVHPQKIKIDMTDFSLEFEVPDRSRLNFSLEELENPV